MANVKLNPVLEKIRGKVGDLVFRRFGTGLVLGRTPEIVDRPLSPAQAAHRERFKLAAAYGRAVMADPATKAIYLASPRNKNTSVFALCIGDFMKPPVVHDIDLSHYTGKAGETIRITASDDFEVTGVEVAITTQSGQRLERGPAGRDPFTKNWVYTTSVAIPAGERVSIEVTAMDRPGHKASRIELVG